MARRHIIFLPWADGGGFSKVDKWDEHAQSGDLSVDYHYEKILYGDGTTLNNLPWFSEIYVYGHCDAGSHHYTPEAGGNLKYDVVADRLLSHGLQKTWCGAVKLYACRSGLCTLGRQSFAAKFGQYMRFTKGYHLISYVGYLGYMTQEQIAGLCPNHLHKRCRIPTPFGEIKVKSKWGKAFF